MDYYKEALEMHEKHHGKISIALKTELNTREDLSTAYTPGVAAPCMKIHDNPFLSYNYTIKGNTVAVVTDGSAVLGLGNIGPEAALPVMEGKAMLFKKFGDVDAFPICLDTQNIDEIIRTVKYLAPVFGGINLEDISAPKCFEIEDRLQKELNIPVFHDDQHGTAIVVVAALINSLKIVGKTFGNIKVVLNGPGAAGTAIIKMLHHAGVLNIIACDRKGILSRHRNIGMTPAKRALCDLTNQQGIDGFLSDAIKGADVFIGTSAGNILTPEMVAEMNRDPIVFALANPIPEIEYEAAKKAGARIVGTGRSDCPNQINNVLVFPGMFRGALNVKATKINNAMKFAAAEAIASIIPPDELNEENVIPSVFDMTVSKKVASAVSLAAARTGVARK